MHGAGKSRSQPLKNRNARVRAQTKTEVRLGKETETSQSQEERKKETVKQGKPGEQPEKSQETGSGPPARHSVVSHSQTRPHISIVILESV